jgi:hypothetical protein
VTSSIDASPPPELHLRSGGHDRRYFLHVPHRVVAGGHTWPGARISLPCFIFGPTTRSFDATTEIWSFLVRHRLAP